MKAKTLIFLLAIMSILATSQLAHAGEWADGAASTNFGTRNYRLWIPSESPKQKSAPLIMMLHGCTQKRDDLAAISGMNTIADNNGFFVVYPEQTAAANPLRCWNWFDPKHQSRDSGEPALLAAIVKQVEKSQSIDASRVYVAGISAGAAMAIIMGVS